MQVPCPLPITWLFSLHRTAGTLFGEGFRAFVTDWDKVTATVCIMRPQGCAWQAALGVLGASLVCRDPVPADRVQWLVLRLVPQQSKAPGSPCLHCWLLPSLLFLSARERKCS